MGEAAQPFVAGLLALVFLPLVFGLGSLALVASLVLLLAWLGYTPDTPADESFRSLSVPGCSERWSLGGDDGRAPSAHVRRWRPASEPEGRPQPDAEHVVVVCLHGTFSSSHEFEAWAKELHREAAASGRSMEVFAVDLPGHGLTGAWQPVTSSLSGRGGPAPYSLDADVAFLEELVKHPELSGRRIVLVGHSIGGAIAAAYAARSPRAVAALVLLAPWGLRYGTQDGDMQQHCTWFVKFVLSPRWRFLSVWLCLLMVRVTPWLLLRYALGTAFGPGAVGAGEPAPTSAQVRRAADLLHAHMLCEGNRATFVTRISHMVAEERQAWHSRARCRAGLQKLRCPVQLQWGEADTWLHADRCASWAGALGERAADVRLWPGVGHCLPEQTPQKSATAAWVFLKGVENVGGLGGPPPALAGG